MKYWREAATLILALRPRSLVASPLSAARNVLKSAGKPENSNNDFRILMLRRSSKSSFMPSKMVFPGGVLQEVDHLSAWQNVYKNVTGQSLEEISQELNSSKLCVPLLTEKRDWTFSADIAFRICAIRETFEESGILLATNRIQRSQLACKDSLPFHSASSLIIGDDTWRKKVEKDPLQFLALCQELSVVPDVWSLKVWRNWLTPVFTQVMGPPKKPRRFDTMFYVACIDCDVIPNALPDETESTHAEWKGADEYFQIYMKREPDYPPLAPPQIYELAQMRTFQHLEQLNTACDRKVADGLIQWMPVYRLCKDAILIILPGDFLYPSNPDFNGIRQLPDPYLCTLSELTDQYKPMNRITFLSSEQLNISSVDTTIANTADVDSLLQKGEITCNI